MRKDSKNGNAEMHSSEYEILAALLNSQQGVICSSIPLWLAGMLWLPMVKLLEMKFSVGEEGIFFSSCSYS